MNIFKLTSIYFLFAYCTIHAQTYTYPTTGNKDISALAQNNITSSINITLAPNESILFNFTANTVTPSTGINTTADTLTTRFHLRVDGLSSNTDALEFTAVGDFFEETTASITGAQRDANLIFNSNEALALKVVENQVTQITVTNNSTESVYFEALRFFSSNGLTETISNSQDDFFAQGNASVVSPIEEGKLIFHNLPSDRSNFHFNIISMDGQVVLQETISANENSIDVSFLNAGIYLLYETVSRSSTKVIIRY